MLGNRIICMTLSVSRISYCPNNSFLKLNTRRCHEKHILYNTILAEQKLEEKQQALKKRQLESKKSNENSLPIILKYLNNSKSMKLDTDSKRTENKSMKDSVKRRNCAVSVTSKYCCRRIM
ncbi:hypothetical protein WA026_017236 [Henosepilachna vigintioctopunctata]|uniref:Uncharacterized protein n=1 Tax=Henosepilachna vigintioctopunctata TaxID=420089 RepID=A0AAW1UMI3_9CUCU